MMPTTVVIVLLAVIVLLLVVIIVMLATGWPGKQKEDIEQLGNILRREMAEQRSASLQLTKVIRIEIEEAVRESVEREIASALSKGRSRKNTRKKAQEGDSGSVDEIENSANAKPLHVVQIPLFCEIPVAGAQPPAQLQEPAEKIVKLDPDAETIDMGYIDDIPDVE